MDKSRIEPTIFLIEKISFSLKLFSGHFYGQSFIKTVRGPFILLVRTVPFFRKIIFISSYTEKNNYFLLYELIQDLPYVSVFCTLKYSYFMHINTV